MELKVVLNKQDYDNMLKEIGDLKELIGTKVIARTDTETEYGGLGDYRPLRFKVLEKTYKASKEVIDEINEATDRKESQEIKDLKEALETKKRLFDELYETSKPLISENSELKSNNWKNLSLFQRIFKKP